MCEDNQASAILFAASTGGHLAQLHRLSQRFASSNDSLWVTFDTPQSRSLLKNRRVLYVPYIAPRDALGVARAAWYVLRNVDFREFSLAVSTGAALALGVLPAARARGVPAVYIESISRFNGPSLTGRILAASHTVKLHTQHDSWSGSRWRPIRPVLGDLVSKPTAVCPSPRIFVTLGTIKPYRFDSLLNKLAESGLTTPQTVWQVGCTTGVTLQGEQFDSMNSSHFEAQARSADLVVTHAGVGTIMQLLEWGINPVVVPRRRSRGEHVDDHQVQICDYLLNAGLATVLEIEDITAERLVAATGFAVTTTDRRRPLFSSEAQE